jgi:hypothetical protein
VLIFLDGRLKLGIYSELIGPGQELLIRLVNWLIG